jgi:hypothetical protein
VSTVDAFQGQEKEVIVLSLCGGGGGAFASDERLNVALTRAKRHLIVLGDSRDPASSKTEAWRLCLRTARRAPCGFVDAQSVRSEAATNAWLAGWRRNDEEPIAGRDIDREPASPKTRRDEKENARAQETFSRDEKSDGDKKSDDDDDDDDDASLASPSPSPDPFDPIVLSGDEDTLFVPAGSPLSRSPLSFRGEETAAAKRRVVSCSASPLAKKKKKTLLRLERSAGDEPRVPRVTKRRAPESVDEEPATKSESRSVSPDPDLDSLPPARLLFHDALRGVSFGPEQYWRAYCDLHRAALYGDKSARARVECSRLGAVLATHFRLDLGVSNAWDSSSTRRLVTSAVLPGDGDVRARDARPPLDAAAESDRGVRRRRRVSEGPRGVRRARPGGRQDAGRRRGGRERVRGRDREVNDFGVSSNVVGIIAFLGSSHTKKKRTSHVFF